MNELLQKYKDKFMNYWQQLEKGQKIKIALIAVFLVASLSLFTILSTRTKYALTFTDLDQKTAGKIVTKLDEMGVPYQLSAGGSNISVPEAQSDKVKVSLAEDVGSSGNIYLQMLGNPSIGGYTNEEFELIKRGAIQEELRQLIVGIEGIKDAVVKITLPPEKVFYSEDQGNSTASVVLNLEPGVELSPKQIKSIYHLIAGSVQYLSIEDINLTDQYGYSLDYIENDNSTDISTYDQQHKIEQNFQQDLKKQIESILVDITGPKNVTVGVMAKMNFDKVTMVEKTFEPVVDNEGIARSAETIQESFSGKNPNPGGVPGTGPEQIPSYPSNDSTNGDYEFIKKTINYEVNEITKQVQGSPYRLEDLGVNIAINLDANSQKAAQAQQAILTLIKPLVSAALGINDDTQVSQKIAVVAYQFEKPQPIIQGNQGLDPLYVYGGIGLAILALGGISLSVSRRNRRRREQEELEMMEVQEQGPEFDFSPPLTEEAILQQEIQKFLKNKPQEFVKLIRTWISEE